MYGKIELSIPRDRKGEYEPVVVKKHQRSIASIEDRILSMYARGMTYKDIQAHMEEIYGSACQHRTKMHKNIEQNCVDSSVRFA